MTRIVVVKVYRWVLDGIWGVVSDIDGEPQETLTYEAPDELGALAQFYAEMERDGDPRT